MQVIPGTGVLLSVEYSPDGVSWARVYDNQVTGLVCDETDPKEPQPMIIGSLPTPAPDTSPIVSPQWGVLATRGVRWGGVLINP
jgi:hypothetical protein